MYRRTSYQPNSSSSTKSRCDKNFLKSDKTIDLNAIKDYNIKFANKAEIYDKFIKYKTNQKAYNKINGFLIKNSCKDYLQYEKDEARLNSKKQIQTKKYETEIKNCKTLKNNETTYLKEYIQSLSTGIKSKIQSKIKKTLNKPKDKRINRFACYIKLLIDISNSMECRGNSIIISNIINNFSSKYIRADKSINKQNGAKHYLEYLISNKTIIPNDLKDYKMWYKNDEEFVKALESVIKDYANCK